MPPAYLSLTRVKTAGRAHPFHNCKHDDTSPRIVPLIRNMDSGQPFEPSDLPTTLVKSDARPFKRHVVSTGFLFLSPTATDVFRNHDLGDGFIWDVTLVGKNEVPLPDEPMWGGLYIGAVKDSIDVAASTGVKKAFGMTTLDSFRIETGAKELVLSECCADGADIWREAALTGQLYPFFSASIASALEAAGIAGDFDLIACRSP